MSAVPVSLSVPAPSVPSSRTEPVSILPSGRHLPRSSLSSTASPSALFGFSLFRVPNYRSFSGSALQCRTHSASNTMHLLCSCVIASCFIFSVIYAVRERSSLFVLHPSTCPLFHGHCPVRCNPSTPNGTQRMTPFLPLAVGASYHAISLPFFGCILPCTALTSLCHVNLGHHCSANNRPATVSPPAPH